MIISAIANDYGLVKQATLDNKKVGVISLSLYANNFIGVGGYNEQKINEVIALINKHASFEKLTTIAVKFGDFSGYPGIPFVERHHQGDGPIKPVEIPIFYSSGYIQYVRYFFAWFFDRLQKVWDKIHSFKATAVNQLTAEWRVPDQDFQTKETTSSEAFNYAATKWLSLGYTEAIAYNACNEILQNFKIDKQVLYCSVGQNAFPCVKGDQLCHKDERPKISDILLTTNPFLSPMWCSLINGASIPKALRVPKPNFQLNKQAFGNGGSQTTMSQIMTFAESLNTDVLEIFEPCVKYL